MTNSTPKRASPGWYSTPDGQQRYFDGENWLDLPAPGKKKRSWILPVIVTLVLLVGAGSAGYVYVNNQEKQRAEAEAAIAAEEAEKEAEQEAEEKAAQDQAEKDEAEKDRRRKFVTDLEDDVSTLAEEHIRDGVIVGEVLNVSCNPVQGGSLENLLDTTTVFQCFVATEDLGDDKARGHDYNATVNWDSGEYTYSYGKP